MLPRELTRHVRRLGLWARRSVTELLAGEYRSIFRGRGVTFEEVRPYQPGDDVRFIDWNVTARMGQPFVKQCAEERELSVVLALDCSGSQQYGTGPSRKREVAGELAAVLAFAAISNNDRVGLAAFTDRVEHYVSPGKGVRHGLRLIRDALYWQPVGRGTSLRNCLEYLERVTRRRGVLVLLSDFLDSGFRKALKRAARRHDVIAFRIRDPSESSLPPARFCFEDAETGEAEEWQAVASCPARESHADSLPEWARATAVEVVEFSTDGSHLDALMRFFRARARGARR